MGKLSPILRGGTNFVTFWCPGCAEHHSVTTVGNPSWTYNNNPDLPTFTPSIHIKSGHYVSWFKPGDPCWCTWPGKDKHPDIRCKVCHSFVTDGMIQFLPDCTHALAGQTVPLPPLPRYSDDVE